MKKVFFIKAMILCVFVFAASSYAGNAGSLQIQAAVRAYIETHMPWPAGTARVDFLSGEPQSTPQDTAITLRVEPAGNADFIGDMAFLVRYFKQGLCIKTEVIRVRIEVLHDVVVAVRALPFGTVITDGDIRMMHKWVRKIHPQALSSLSEATGKQLSVQLQPGAEISENMLKEVPLVRKGKMVKVIFDSRAMKIVTVGMSEEDGVAGSMIRIRNMTSHKIMYARVIGDSLVHIEL